MKTIKEAKHKSEIELSVDASLERFGIKFEVFAAGAGLKRDGWECDGWRASFTADGKPNEPQEFDFYTGMGHRVDYGPGYQRLKGESINSLSSVSYQKNHVKPFAPFAASVLYSLILDSNADDMSFSSWCDDYGYDSDSLKALNTYNTCCDNAKRMRKVFTREQLNELSELLQDY